MNLDVTYTNHRNESVSIGRYEDWHTIGTDLHDYAWAYNDTLSYIPQLYRKTQEKKLHMGLWAESEADGLERRNEIVDIMERDTRANVQGRITIGEYYLECMVIKSEKDYWHFDDNILEMKLTLLCKKPIWWAERKLEFLPSDDVITGDFLDFPFDFPFDFADVNSAESLNNLADHASDFRFVIFGFAANPSIRIGTNVYQVNVSVPIGGQLIIDSRDRSVVIRDMYGAETSVYDKRLRGSAGSGSYIFESIPSGVSAVSWQRSYGFSLILFDDRSEPRWT